MGAVVTVNFLYILTIFRNMHPLDRNRGLAC